MSVHELSGCFGQLTCTWSDWRGRSDRSFHSLL